MLGRGSGARRHSLPRLGGSAAGDLHQQQLSVLAPLRVHLARCATGARPRIELAAVVIRGLVDMGLDVDRPPAVAEPLRDVDDAARLGRRLRRRGDMGPGAGREVHAPDLREAARVLLDHEAVVPHVEVVGTCAVPSGRGVEPRC